MKKRRLLFCLLMITLTAFDLALTMKSAVGIGAYDSFQKTLNAVTHIKVGTISMFFNITFVLIQIAFLRKKANISVLIQIPMNILIGLLINFFLYDVFGETPFDSYAVRVGVVVVTQLLNAAAAGAMLMTGVITFSLEGACNLIAKKLGTQLNRIRLGVDIFCMVASVVCTLVFAVPLTIREGTIISAICFGPALGIMMKLMRPIMEKYDLADPQ